MRIFLILHLKSQAFLAYNLWFIISSLFLCYLEAAKALTWQKLVLQC